MLEIVVGEPENLLLVLVNLPGDPDPTLPTFLSAFINGPNFVSSGRGFNKLSSPVGFSFIAFSFVNFMSFHGLILTWNFCFLTKGEEGSLCPSILIDNLVEL